MTMKARSSVAFFSTAVLFLAGCSQMHIVHDKHYWDRRPQGATNGPGDRNPGTPGSGLTNAGVNTGSGESANPIR